MPHWHLKKLPPFPQITNDKEHSVAQTVVKLHVVF